MHSCLRWASMTIMACAALATPAGAATAVYEGFNYLPAGSNVLGQSGGFGFSSAWDDGGFNASIHDNYDVASGTLNAPPLTTSGERASTSAVNAIAGLTRTFTTPLGADGTTAYLSVLLRPEGTLHNGDSNGFFGIYLDGDLGLGSGEPDLFIGKPGGDAIGNYVVENRGGAGQVDTGVAAALGQTALLVLKAEFLNGADRFTLYVNPTPGGLEPAAGTVKTDLDLGAVSGLAIYSTGAFSVDEIRVGPTFADVTPVVPLPNAALGGLAVLGAGMFAKFVRGRRRVTE